MNKFWKHDGKLVVNGSGRLIAAPNCPCDAPCNYCCDPPLASSYTITLSADLTVQAPCCSFSKTWVGGTAYVVENNPAYWDDCYWTWEESLGECAGATWYAMIVLYWNPGSYWICQFHLADSINGNQSRVVASVFGEVTGEPPQCDPTADDLPYSRGAVYGCSGGAEDGSTKSVSVD